MPNSKSSTVLWNKANKQTAARHGLSGSDPSDAFVALPLPIHKLIENINEPGNLSLLAARSHELNPEQRVEFLKRYNPPEAAEPKKAKPKKVEPRRGKPATAPKAKPKATAKAKARKAWLNWAPTTGPMAGISLVGSRAGARP